MESATQLQSQRPPAGPPPGSAAGAQHPMLGEPPAGPPGQPPRPLLQANPPGGLAPGTPPPLFPPQGMPGAPPPMSRPPLLQPPGGMPLPRRFPSPRPPGPGGPPSSQAGPGMPRPPQPLMRGGPPSAQPRQQPPQVPPVSPGSQTEVWFEHTTADGRVYFSNPQTQKTTWDRPANAQIIPQPPTGGMGPGPGPGMAPGPGHPVGLPNLPPPFPLPLPGMPGAPQLVPTRVWSEHKSPEGKTYYYNKVTRQSIWEKPKDFELVMPLPINFGVAPPSRNSPVNSGPGAVPIPTSEAIAVAQPFAKQPPPQQHQPQQPSLQQPLPQQPLPQQPSPQQPSLQQPHQPIPPQQLPPQHPQHQQPVPPPQQQTQPPQPPLQQQQQQQQQPPVDPTGGNSETGQPDETGAAASPSDQAQGSSEGAGVETESMEMDQQTRDQPDENQQQVVEEPQPQSQPQPQPPAPQFVQVPAAVPIVHQLQPHPPVYVREEPKGPRPISSVPIPGTPWSVVWTSDERQFFFDATSRVSVWTIPQELAENPQVTKILDEPPGRKKRVGELVSESLAKRPRLDEDEGREEEGQQMGEEGEGLGVDVPVLEVTQRLTDTAESERKLAMMKAGKSLETRQREFKEMLLERGVSAFSTWDKELPKFVFDPRYMLLSPRERKACFEAFIRSRAEDERKEKKTKMKAQKDNFRKLLEECKLAPKSNFSEFAMKYGKDERFRNIEKMREREQLFTEYVTELRKASRQREEHQKRATKSKAEKVKSDFLAMLSESETIHERSQWRKVKSSFDHDPRYKAVEDSGTREEWFSEHVQSLANKSDPEQERQDRIAASLKEREREVQMSRSAQEREWGRERDHLRKTEATQHFKALLVDMVRHSDSNWHETKRSLRKDHRWELAELLESSERERLFREHVDGLAEKKRMQFRKLLEETPQITLTMPWKKARKYIKEDPRYKNFSDSDHRREAEYDKYLKDRMIEAKNEFRALLRETKILTYKSYDMTRESEKHEREIVGVLKHDQRYLVLECVADERDAMLQEYIWDLYQKGPPPPPTATNPADRLKRP